VKALIISAVVLIVLFFTALNSSMIADQALAWVKEHPKDPSAPEVLYRAARWCDLLGDNNKARAVYWDIYEQYPEKGEYCAPALYYIAQIISDTTSARRQANTYLQIVIDQYPNVDNWGTKAKELYDEVNNVH
jgi:TolA-binding protein